MSIFKNRILKIYEENEKDILKSITKRKTGTYAAVFYEEDIYIENMEVPRVRNSILKDIVKNQMIYRFSNMENINFSYEVISRSREKINLRMFCINTEKNELLKAVSSFITINKIILIQFCYAYYFSTKVKEDAYSILFYSKDYIYFLQCDKHSIVNNTFVREDDFRNNKLCIFKDINIYDCKRVYMINMKEHLDNTCFIEDTDIVDMGTVKEDKIIALYTGGI